MSMRAVSRVTGVARQTVSDLLEDIGQACSEYQDDVLRNLPCSVVEADEIWSFCYSKQKNVPDDLSDTFGYGDVWTWTAIDAKTKLVPSWLVGERTMADCYTFLADLKSRLRNARIQLTTDGLGHYLRVVDGLWADKIDYAMLHKIYGGASWECQVNLAPPRSLELAPPREVPSAVTQSSTGVRLSLVCPA
jgi:hypothetical protein